MPWTKLFNSYITIQIRGSASYEVMASCIRKIYIECLGYQQADNGYWNSETLTETYQITGGQQVESLMKVQQDQKPPFE